MVPGEGELIGLDSQLSKLCGEAFSSQMGGLGAIVLGLGTLAFGLARLDKLDECQERFSIRPRDDQAIGSFAGLKPHTGGAGSRIHSGR